ncbi:MAG: ABC transporter substrate-binding protein [Oscillospiraceae bacterium]|nr:ABC transporter substrate-binding protein [Oscillospiraceae bacterium]
MKLKKKLVILLAFMMLLPILAACANDTPTPNDTQQTDPTAATTPGDTQNGDDPVDTPAVTGLRGGTQPGTVWTVGVNLINADALNGWTNAVGNAQMRTLTRENASPVVFSRGAEFIINPAVAANVDGPVVNADGSRTWTITLQDGLRWSDGHPLTAVDYAFTYLFWGAPAMSFAGTDEDNPLPNLGNTFWANSSEVNGFDAYRTLEDDVLTGVRLIDELTFSITIDAYTNDNPNFPYFYELTYIGVDPLPLHAFAPGRSVNDNGRGVYVSDGGLTYELLRTTIDDGVDGGFRYTLGPTAGAYMLAAPVDMEAYTIVLQVNPYFHGTYDGTLPSIETLILRRVDHAVQIPELQQGGIDLLQGISGAAAINPGLDLVAGGGFGYFAMPRNGSGGLFFHQDVGPTQFVEVRRAIAWTLDRVEFNNIWAAGHATTLDTLVGVAQWMYQENRDAVPGLMTFNYTLNLANATAELEAGGWIYNTDGEPWQAGDGPRAKMVDGELMPLVLRWASPDANDIGSILSSLMTEPANSVGIYFDQEWVTTADFSPALLGLNPDNRYSMINGGLGIPPIDAVWFSYGPHEHLFGQWNWTRTTDAELYSYALGRRNASNREEYLEAWKGFIARFNYILPVLPLNSDIFHDFYREGLMNYEPTSLFTWERAIVWAYLDGYDR